MHIFFVQLFLKSFVIVVVVVVVLVLFFVDFYFWHTVLLNTNF